MSLLVIWVVIMRGHVSRYNIWKEHTASIFSPQDEGSMFSQNFGLYLHAHTMFQPKRPIQTKDQYRQKFIKPHNIIKGIWGRKTVLLYIRSFIFASCTWWLLQSVSYCNSIRLFDTDSIQDGSLLLTNIPTTTVKFSSQLSKHAKTIPQCTVIL
jgi:hypothetical protein